jgi:two-component system nitrate/nitrite response regulator NarL
MVSSDKQPGAQPQIPNDGAIALTVVVGDDRQVFLDALRAGASGYLHKTRGITALTEAMSRIQRGEVVVNVPKAAGSRRTAPQDGMHRLAGYLTTP